MTETTKELLRCNLKVDVNKRLRLRSNVISDVISCNHTTTVRKSKKKNLFCLRFFLLLLLPLTIFVKNAYIMRFKENKIQFKKSLSFIFLLNKLNDFKRHKID